MEFKQSDSTYGEQITGVTSVHEHACLDLYKLESCFCPKVEAPASDVVIDTISSKSLDAIALLLETFLQIVFWILWLSN